MPDQNSGPHITSVLNEHRTFEPPDAFRAKAHIAGIEAYEALYKRSVDDPDAFWSDVASELHWFRRWDSVLEWKEPFAQWFVGGETNVSYNCLDRHLDSGRRNKAAIVWEGEPGDERILTYQGLHREVCRFANVLKTLGVRKGDRVAIYMGMVPELAIAMLACARIGAPHSIVFGGFSGEALRDRINDAEARVVVTADGAFRRGTIVELKHAVDIAVAECPTVTDVVVVRRTGHKVEFAPGRDHWWHELLEGAASTCDAEWLDAEHPLYILYTSGTTGKPKGIVHTTGGYMVATYKTAQWVFDLRDDDVYWCTADIGWVTGHSYVVYGPLANGATVVMYEGAPNHPDPARFWNWYYFWDYSGGLLVGQAAHVIDAIQWYMGSQQPVAVTCAGGRVNLDGAEIPETACLAIEYPENYLATFTIGYKAMRYNPYNDQIIQFHGSKARLDLGRERYALYAASNSGDPRSMTQGLSPHSSV